MKCPMKFASDDKSKKCEREGCAWWTVRKDMYSGDVLAKGCAIAFAQTPAAVSGLIVENRS